MVSSVHALVAFVEPRSRVFVLLLRCVPGRPGGFPGQSLQGEEDDPDQSSGERPVQDAVLAGCQAPGDGSDQASPTEQADGAATDPGETIGQGPEGRGTQEEQE